MKGRVLVKKSHNGLVLVKGRGQMMVDPSGKMSMLFGGSGGDDEKRGKLSRLGGAAGTVLGALGPHRSMSSLFGGMQAGGAMGSQAGGWAGKKLGRIGRGIRDIPQHGFFERRKREREARAGHEDRNRQMREAFDRRNAPPPEADLSAVPSPRKDLRVHVKNVRDSIKPVPLPEDPKRVKVTKPTGPMAQGPVPHGGGIPWFAPGPQQGAAELVAEEKRDANINENHPHGDHTAGRHTSESAPVQPSLFDSQFRPPVNVKPPMGGAQPPVPPPLPTAQKIATLPEIPPEEDTQ